MRAAVLLYVLLLIVPLASAQHGAITSPRNLADLTERADLIVHGRVVSALAEPHPKYPNLTTVVVTVLVQDTLKGKSDRVHTFRQFVWDERDSRSVLGYRKGQEVLLLLNRVNDHGLTSPVGLEQGRFRIEAASDGTPMAVNGNGNQALFDGVADTAKRNGVRLSARGSQIANAAPSGPVRLQDLQDMIRSFVGTK
jgi:hypothetical protein